MTASSRGPVVLRLGAAIVAVGLAVAGCGGDASPSAPAAGGPGKESPSASGQTGSTGTTAPAPVLPVTGNPITSGATAQTLQIDSVLVENNVDPATGADTPDHLEVALRNNGTTPLTNVEVFYSFTDAAEKISESYYTKLDGSFTVPAGGVRVVHFDSTGRPDHYPVNTFSLYSTSTNALDVSVTVSAADAAPQTAKVRKDAGGAENPDE